MTVASLSASSSRRPRTDMPSQPSLADVLAALDGAASSSSLSSEASSSSLLVPLCSLDEAFDFARKNGQLLRTCFDPYPSSASREARGGLLDQGGRQSAGKSRSTDAAGSYETNEKEWRQIALEYGLDDPVAERLYGESVRQLETDLRSNPPPASGAAGFPVYDISVDSQKLVETTPSLRTAHFEPWYFDHRIKIIEICAALYRLGEDASHAQRAEAHQIVFPFSEDGIADDILRSIGLNGRMKQALPSLVRRNADRAARWALQAIKEQVALLRLLFLVFYNQVQAKADQILEIFRIIGASEFGTVQEVLASAREDCQDYLIEMQCLWSIIALEVIALETWFHVVPEDVFDSKDDLTVIGSCQAALQIDDYINDHARGRLWSPMLLGWAYILSKVTEAMEEHDTPEEFVPLAERLLQLTKETKLFSRYAGSALSAGVFATVKSILTSAVMDTHHSDSLAYQSVLDTVMTSASHIFRPGFLLDQSSFLDCHLAMLDQKPLVVDAFWTDYDNGGPKAVLLLSLLQRFPADPSGLLDLLVVLSGGSSSDHSPSHQLLDESISAAGPTATFNFLSDLTQVTQVLPSRAEGLYALEIDQDDSSWVTLLKDVLIYRLGGENIVLPAGSQGRVLGSGPEMAVQFAWQWSAWTLLGSVVLGFGRAPSENDLAADSNSNMIDLSAYNAADTQSMAKILHIIANVSMVSTEAAAAVIESLIPHLRYEHALSMFCSGIESLFRAVLDDPQFSKSLLAAAMRLLVALVPVAPLQVSSVIRTLLGDVDPVPTNTQDLEKLESVRRPVSLERRFAQQIMRDAIEEKPVIMLLFLDLTEQLATTAARLEQGRERELVLQVLQASLNYTHDIIFAQGVSRKNPETPSRIHVLSALFKLCSRLLDSCGKEIMAFVNRILSSNTSEIIPQALITIRNARLRLRDGAQDHASHVTLLISEQTTYALQFLTVLLKHHQDQGMSSSRFQDLSSAIFDPSNEVLLHISELVHTKAQRELVVKALQLLTLLIMISGERRVSVLELLSPDNNLDRFLTVLMELALSHSQVLQIRLGAWYLLDTLVSFQVSIGLRMITEGNASKRLLQAVSEILRRHDVWTTREAEILASVACFFETCWSHVVEYSHLLQDLRRDQTLWEALIKFATSTTPLPSAEAEVRGEVSRRQCAVNLAKAHILQALAYEFAFHNSLAGEDAPLKGVRRAETGVAHQLFIEAIVSTDCILEASNDVDFGAWDRIFEDSMLSQMSLEALDMSPYRTWHSEKDLDRLDCFSSLCQGRSSNAIDQSFVELLTRASWEVNTDMTRIRAFRSCVDQSVTLLSGKPNVGIKFFESSVSLARKMAAEKRSGSILESAQLERGLLLVSMLKITAATSFSESADAWRQLCASLLNALNNEALPASDCLQNGHQPYHRPILTALRCVLTHLLSLSSDALHQSLRSSLDLSLAVWLRRVLEHICAPSFSNVNDKAGRLEDFVLLASLVQTSFRLGNRSFLVHEVGAQSIIAKSIPLLRTAASLSDDECVLSPLLDLLITFAEESATALDMTTDGLFVALLDTRMAAYIAEKTLKSSDYSALAASLQIHWIRMINLTTALVHTLQNHAHFLEVQAVGFVRLFQSQLLATLDQDQETAVTRIGLQELRATAALFQALAQKGAILPDVVNIAKTFSEHCINGLQNLCYLMQHPKYLAASVRSSILPASIDLHDLETDAAPNHIIEETQMQLHLTVLQLLQALNVSCSTLRTLTSDVSEWHLDRVVLQPSMKIALGGRLSAGTLLDLVKTVLEAARSDLIGQNKSLKQTSADAGLDSSKKTKVQIVEACLCFMVSQLACWAKKPGTDPRILRDIKGEMSVEIFAILQSAVNLEREALKSTRHSMLSHLQAFMISHYLKNG